ncbi:hypothetical protein ENUP19_0121G0175 [Entamoeba nuttalli]|uniref:TATA-binding protein-associated phosphoprotein n=1 Tax=Entamoeba nuttalli TaxID=412467 RepID=A0ABQ0DIY9_9EUKA
MFNPFKFEIEETKEQGIRNYTLPPEIKINGDENRVCKTPIEKRIPVLRASREARNNFTLQQTLCICLLSRWCRITIKKPTRRSCVTEQFFRINSIEHEEDKIDVYSFLKKRCNEMYLFDIQRGVSEKTAIRRYQNNKKIEVIHLMEDILREYGVELETKTTEGKSGINRLENITGIYISNQVIPFDGLIMNLIEINHILLNNVLQSNGELIIDQNQFSFNF